MNNKEILEKLKADIATLHSNIINIDENISLEDLKKLKNHVIKRFEKIQLDDKEEDCWRDIDAPIPPDDSSSIKTGMKRFDSWNVLRKKRQLCFIGKTGEGKTLSMENLASMVAKQGYKVAYLSFEVEWGEVQKRIICQCLNIEEEKFGNYEPYEISKRFLNEKIKKPVIFYDPYATYSPDELKERILKKEEDMGEKFDIIFIDYLGIIDSPEDNMYEKGKAISAAFMRYAKGYNWAIVSAAQANRAGMIKVIPSLDDIAESMGINHYFDWMISILHYSELRKRKLFAFSLQKARYVSNNNYVGVIDVFKSEWEYAGKFSEVNDKDNEEISKMIISDNSKDPKKVGVTTVSSTRTKVIKNDNSKAITVNAIDLLKDPDKLWKV